MEVTEHLAPCEFSPRIVHPSEDAGGPGKTRTCICERGPRPTPAVFRYTTGPTPGLKPRFLHRPNAALKRRSSTNRLFHKPALPQTGLFYKPALLQNDLLQNDSAKRSSTNGATC